MNRHKLIVAGCLIVILILGGLVTSVWRDQRTRQHVNDTIIAKQVADRNKLHQDLIKLQYDKANTECKKGQVAWDALKVKTDMRPVCDLQIVQ